MQSGVMGSSAAQEQFLWRPLRGFLEGSRTRSVTARLSCPQERLQEMGPYGPLLFVVTVACAELIPLFPTQPLSLASGLLFGPRLVRLLLLSWCLSEVECCFGRGD